MFLSINYNFFGLPLLCHLLTYVLGLSSQRSSFTFQLTWGDTTGVSSFPIFLFLLWLLLLFQYFITVSVQWVSVWLILFSFCNKFFFPRIIGLVWRIFFLYWLVSIKNLLRLRETIRLRPLLLTASTTHLLLFRGFLHILWWIFLKGQFLSLLKLMIFTVWIFIVIYGYRGD